MKTQHFHPFLKTCFLLKAFLEFMKRPGIEQAIPHSETITYTKTSVLSTVFISEEVRM